MTHRFDDSATAGVLGHMNADHAEDSLLIVQAFAPDAAASAAVMTGFDGDGGEWAAQRRDGTSITVRVPWPSGAITERRDVRREIVALYDEACRRLGVSPRAHS